MNGTEILLIEWVMPAGIKVAIGPIGIVLICIISAIGLVVRFGKLAGPDWDVVEAQIDIPRIGHVKIHRNPEVMRIAHQAWTELQTRKAALPFDEDHDVINEVYDSWYMLFGEFRRLIKSVPAERIKRNKDTEKLVEVMIDVLNQGLRPHLTKWQSRFRAWQRNITSTDKSPQELQRMYPDYTTLTAELKTVNTELCKYTDFLKRLAHGDKA